MDNALAASRPAACEDVSGRTSAIHERGPSSESIVHLMMFLSIVTSLRGTRFPIDLKVYLMGVVRGSSLRLTARAFLSAGKACPSTERPLRSIPRRSRPALLNQLSGDIHQRAVGPSQLAENAEMIRAV